MQDRRRFLGALAYPAAVAIAPACFTAYSAITHCTPTDSIHVPVDDPNAASQMLRKWR